MHAVVCCAFQPTWRREQALDERHVLPVAERVLDRDDRAVRLVADLAKHFEHGLVEPVVVACELRARTHVLAAVTILAVVRR